MKSTFTGSKLWDFGYLIEAQHGARFQDLPRDQIIHLFERHGALLFRGFEIEPSGLIDAVCLYTKTLLRMDAPSRRDAIGSSGATVLTDYAGMAIPLHSENSYFFPQFWPELIWFYCDQPASKSGHTTLCDGAAAWKELHPALRTRFLEHRIVYRLTAPRELMAHGINADAGEGNIRAALEEASKTGVPGVKTWLDGAGNLHAEVKRHAVHLARDGKTLVFANHVCSFAEPAIDGEITFDDGMPIGARELMQVRAATDRHTRRVDWSKGDLVMIDNRRVMHGRTAYDTGSSRRLISAMTLRANFAYGQSFGAALPNQPAGGTISFQTGARAA